MSIMKSKKGFTLIEIVIVLAIAALILAAVLIAVSGAQKSRRDTARKNDIAKILSYVEQSASNNSGNYPGQTGGAALASFNANYLTNSSMKEPQTSGNYSLVTAAPPATFSGNGQVQISATNCAGAALGARVVSLRYRLESGDLACVDNH